ncbi:uncharacterized protein [Asterias amurensis]|uniref:uncharacterized protein n=1 Tax=Asterias amurensis TaxID=7602 RepID=UPI003AB8EA9A
MASNDQLLMPRITHEAIVNIGKFLDPVSPTRQDWRVLASLLRFQDSWIQNVECECLPTGKSPTANVLRAWQERLPVSKPLPVQHLIDCLESMGRIDAASRIKQMVMDERFLDPDTSKTYCTSYFLSYHCQSGQQTSQINDSSVRSKRSAQENSYHGPERCCYCEQRMTTPTCEHQLTSQNYDQLHRPKNGQSVVSLSSAISDKSENSQMPSHRNNMMTWPFKKGDGMSAQDRHLSPSHVSIRGELHQCQFQPVEQQACTHQDINYQQDGERLNSRPFRSLVSTTLADGRRYDREERAVRGPCPESTVDHMMMENPTRASPNQLENLMGTDASMLITYAYKNFKPAHKLAGILKKKGHGKVEVDTNEGPIREALFKSVNYVIIIYTQDYIKEVSGNVETPLNTRAIYHLMAEEFKRRGNRNLRFVPIHDWAKIDRDSVPLFLRDYPRAQTRYICRLLESPQETPRQETPRRENPRRETPERETQGQVSIQRKVWVSSPSG